MTIRRNVDLNAINRDYDAFQFALSELSRSAFPFARRVQEVVTNSIDELELIASVQAVRIDRCDRIREVEALTFDMIRLTNPDSEIEQVIKIGHDLDGKSPARVAEYLANLSVTA